LFVQNFRFALIAVIFWIEDVAKVPANDYRYPDRTGYQCENNHIRSIRDNLRDIEAEEQRLERATMRLENWH